LFWDRTNSNSKRNGLIFLFSLKVFLFSIVTFVGGGLWAVGSLQFSNHHELQDSVLSDGVLTLKWKAGGEVVLQQDRTEEFKYPIVRYRGKDSASVITGLAEGTHYFRFKKVDQPGWSLPLSVKVQFVNHTLLYSLLSLGGAVSLLTVGAIVYGARKSHRLDAVRS
jgi:hypothetical protein